MRVLPVLRGSVAACALLLATTLAVAAQPTDVEEQGSIVPFLGVGLGGGAFPGALQPECQTGFDGRTPGASLDLRGGVAIDRFHLETRTAFHGSMVLEDCLFLGAWHPEGVHTTDWPAMERGGFALTDVRAGYALRRGPLYWVLAGGLGWVWRADLPVLLVASGVGVGRRVRLGLDGEWLGYRMRWNTIEEQWLNGEVVREISRSEWHDWRSGNSIRLSLEIAPVTFH